MLQLPRLSLPGAAVEALVSASEGLDPDLLGEAAAQRATLEAAVAAAPGLRDTLIAARRELAAAGAVLFEGTPLSDAALVVFAAVAGHAVAEGNGIPERLVWDVCVAESVGEEVIRSQRADAFGLHTDSSNAPRPHEFVGLACVTSAEDGSGRSLLVSAELVADTLRREYGERVVRLLADASFPFAAPPESGSEVYRFAILGAEPVVRYREPVLRYGLELADPPLDAEHRAALEAFEDVVEREAIAAMFGLVAGDFLLFDNRRVLHGRTRIASGPGSVSARHLKRLKLYAHDRAAGPALGG